MRKLSLLLLALAGTVQAQTPDQFAWQWPIALEGDQGAYRLDLDEAVYARITRADLRDLAAFNADGQPVPFAPLAYAETQTRQHSELRWLRLPVEAAPSGDSLSLRLERDSDGRVRELQLDSGTTAPASPSTDLLIDLGEKDPPSVSSLRLGLDAQAALPVNLRVEVLASDDLAQWQVLGRDLAVVAINDNGLRIERLRLDFDASHQRYLRLRVASGSTWPALVRIEHERRETGRDLPELREVAIEGQPVDGKPGLFEYRSAGPFPVERLDLRLPTANTVASVRFEARDDDEAPWYPVTGFTAFRLGGGSDEVRHLPADVGLQRQRQWRVVTEPALAQAPTLVLGYRPDRFVLLTQGSAPYRLMAGSTHAARPDYPVQAALAAAGASKPSGWQPPRATLGDGAVAAGEAALSPLRGPQYRRWLLWAVLAVGAGLVLLVSLRVLRTPPAA
jgi:hypothetical protein